MTLATRLSVGRFVFAALLAASGYAALRGFPWWRVVGFMIGFVGYTWIAEREGYAKAMSRYEQTRAYLLREGWIDK